MLTKIIKLTVYSINLNYQKGLRPYAITRFLELQYNVVYSNVYYPERQISGPVFILLTTYAYEYFFEQCGDSLERQSLKNAWNKLWPDFEGEKHFNDDHGKKITDFVQSIPGFQEYDEEDVETRMACDEEDWKFQMLIDEEIVTSVQEESYPVDDETDEDEDHNKESNKGASNADAFSALEIAMGWYEQQSEYCPTQLLLLKRVRDLAAKKRRCTMVQRKISDYFPQ
ncbi:hypothetical protein TNCV_1790861 [Trichonephila clavipes]|nr:hypothetical protein TNCV_1790861 [Trichonephila clavipes]